MYLKHRGNLARNPELNSHVRQSFRICRCLACKIYFIYNNTLIYATCEFAPTVCTPTEIKSSSFQSGATHILRRPGWDCIDASIHMSPPQYFKDSKEPFSMSNLASFLKVMQAANMADIMPICRLKTGCASKTPPLSFPRPRLSSFWGRCFAACQYSINQRKATESSFQDRELQALRTELIVLCGKATSFTKTPFGFAWALVSSFRSSVVSIGPFELPKDRK